VRTDVRVLITPCVPGGHPLLEQCDVLIVSHRSTPAWIQPQSSSASRRTAGAAFIFSQSDERPERWREPSRFETIPSQPSKQSVFKTRAGHPASIDGRPGFKGNSWIRRRLKHINLKPWCVIDRVYESLCITGAFEHHIVFER